MEQGLLGVNKLEESIVLSGYLFKWTNILKGYRKRWFLLQGSLLSYYRNPASVGRRCRGTFDLGSTLLQVPSSQTSFILTDSSGRKHHLKALSEDDKGKWVKAISVVIKTGQHNRDAESDTFSDDFTATGPHHDRSSSVATRRRFFRGFRNGTSRLDSTHYNSQNLRHDVFQSRRSDPYSEVSPSVPRNTDDCSPQSVDPAYVSPNVESSDFPASLTDKNVMDTELRNSLAYLNRRLQNRSVSVELTAFFDLLSSVEDFRKRLNNHAFSLSTQLLAIESSLAATETKTHTLGEKSTSGHSIDEGNTASANAQPHVSSEPPTQRLKALLGEHRRYVKEFQNTCLEALQYLVANVERWQCRLSAEQDRCVGLERTIEQLAKQHRALELQLSQYYAPFDDAGLEPAYHSFLDVFRRASITTQSIARTELLDKPDDELFFDARSIQTAQSTESLQNVDHSETSPPYLSLPRTQGLHASITSLSSLQNTEESSCSESSVDDIASNVQPFANLTLPEVPSNELCSPVHAIEHEEPAVRSTEPSCQITRKRRTSVKPSPKIALNLWSVLKNAIGKDITKIPLPVNFNEPISFLQRASEDLTYSYLLDRASQTHDPAEQMALVAAFSVSCYATTAIRTGKPFNPLLGETFEFDRSDDEYGWRLITEQVSHHPPGSALHCESVRYGWKIWVEFVLVSKFRGKYMSVFPKGTVNLSLPDGSRYTWIKACTVVHNLIVGTLWIDNYGDVLIQNHTNNYQCPIRFIAHSYFSKGPPKQVTGTVKTPSGTAVRIIQGSWDSYIESVQVSADGSPTGDPILLWRVQPLPAGSEDMYHFSLFTMELNEPEDGVAPTDSRLRPDQRYMEDGDWDKANEEKRRLEQKQRAKRHRWEQRQAEGIYPSEPLFTPVWFGPATDPVTKETSHVYLNNYWQAKSHQDWVACPDIF